MELTPQEKQALIQLIANCRFTPDEWERLYKPIVQKLQFTESPE
jgi:hypothetical protein